MAQKPRYQRVLLKLSGEMFMGKQESGMSRSAVAGLCEELAHWSKSVQMAIVVGGGNFWRYRDQKSLGLDRVVSDNIGMLATIMNAMTLQSVFHSLGVKSLAMSSISMPRVIDDYTPRLAVKALECGWIVVAAGGTGNPFFSTDSAAALRALELGCEIVLKATNVDYVYDRDPKKYKNAVKYEQVSFQEVLEKGLQVMDLAAISLCQEGHMPIRVFNMMKKGNLEKVLLGHDVGTLIS